MLTNIIYIDFTKDIEYTFLKWSQQKCMWTKNQQKLYMYCQYRTITIRTGGFSRQQPARLC